MSKLEPIHPGEILYEEFMRPLGLSRNALARALGVPRGRINDIVRGQRGITADTALRLSRYLGVEPRAWLNLQNHYDLEIAERRNGPAIREIPPREAI